MFSMMIAEITADLGIPSLTGQEAISWGILLQSCVDLKIDFLSMTRHLSDNSTPSFDQCKYCHGFDLGNHYCFQAVGELME